MRSVFILFSLLFATTSHNLAAQEIISVTPATVSAGTVVTITGGPFAPDVRILVGEREVVPSRPAEHKLVFTVPPLESGEHAIMLMMNGQVLATSFSLRMVEPEPRIQSISPANIDECSTEDERRVTVTGESFSAGAKILLDGAVVAADHGDGSSLIFTAPPLQGGLHHVQVVNPGERMSLAFSLFVNNIPEIHAVEQGPDAVTFYELTIRGKNFLFNSSLIVDGAPINQALVADGSQIYMSPPPQARNDFLTYVDCGTLIYTRYPYSRQAKRISLQVVNPGGLPSPVFHITAP